MARTSTERVAAYRARMREAGRQRMLMEVHLDPEDRAALEAMIAERAEVQTRSETLRQVIRDGTWLVSLDSDVRDAVFAAVRAIFAQREQEAAWFPGSGRAP